MAEHGLHEAPDRLDRFSRYGPLGAREVYFPPDEYAARLEAVRRNLSARQLDLLITFDPANIAYVCGHFSTNLHDFQCLIIPRDRDPIMVLWYFELARFHASATGAVAEAYDTDEDPVPFLLDVLKKHGLAAVRMGLDDGSASVSPAVQRRVFEVLPEGRSTYVQGIIERARLIKSPREIDKLKAASRLTGIGTKAAMAAIRTGARDFEVAAACHEAMFSAGCHWMAVDPYICGGWRGGAPHSTATGHQFAAGDSVFIEVGANVDRYTAPIMRSAAVGHVRAEVKDLHAISNDTLDALIAGIRPGVAAADIAAVGRSHVSRIPDDVIFHYTFGYPVGINFPPSWLEGSKFLLTAANPAPLEVGMVFHLPMSLRSYGRFGIGLSETVVVTPDGVEVLPVGVSREIAITP